jgi:hypothetical protein
VLVDSNDVADRQRFTLAHELGHLLFGDRAHVDTVEGRRRHWKCAAMSSPGTCSTLSTMWLRG